MSVSCKDFQQMATVLAGDLSAAQNGGERLNVRAITLSLADVFARSSPRFNRGCFYPGRRADRPARLRFHA